MTPNFKVLFFLKKGRNRSEKSLPIYVRVTINGERAEWTCQRNCDFAKWNQQTGRAIGNKEETKNLNQYLDAIQVNIFQIQKEYALRKELREDESYTECDLENAIISRLEHIIMELGKGFLFEARHKRISFEVTTFISIWFFIIVYYGVMFC